MKLKADFASADAFEVAVGETLKTGGMMIFVPTDPPARSAAEIAVTAEGISIVELKGEVVYSAPTPTGFQVGLQLQGDWFPTLKTAFEKFVEDRKNGKWGMDSESVFHTISKMTTPEKVQLAVKGNREERRVLMKDTHYMVHPYVLKNPRITIEEVATISRMPSITADMILTIAGTSEWMGNHGVRMAILKNPKTPMPIVQKHMGSLNDTELTTIAKSDGVRDGVSRLAKRILASHGKVVK